MTATHNTRVAAVGHLRNITPSQVEAMNAMDPDDLRTLRDALATLTAHDHADVREHAALIMAQVYAGTPGEGWARTEHACRRSVAIAKRAVGIARQWEGETMAYVGEGMAEIVDTGDGELLCQHTDTSAADAIARTRHADVVDQALTMAAHPSLTRAVTDYRTHGYGDTGEVGRRVTLLGVTAHAEGWDRHDARYHASRRATLSGLAMVDREAVLTSMDHAPLATRPVRTKAAHGEAPVTTEHGAGYSMVTHTFEADTLGYPARYGYAPSAGVHTSTRTMTDAETAPLVPMERILGDGDGNTAPYSSAQGEQTPVPSHKPVVSPRKRAGSGATGPTVPAHLARG